MDEPERKRRGPMLWLAARSWRFWIVVVLSLPVLYVASFGPACWMVAAAANPAGGPVVLSSVYFPIGWAIVRSGGTPGFLIERFSKLARELTRYPGAISL